MGFNRKAKKKTLQILACVVTHKHVSRGEKRPLCAACKGDNKDQELLWHCGLVGCTVRNHVVGGNPGRALEVIRTDGQGTLLAKKHGINQKLSESKDGLSPFPLFCVSIAMCSECAFSSQKFLILLRKKISSWVGEGCPGFRRLATRMSRGDGGTLAGTTTVRSSRMWSPRHASSTHANGMVTSSCVSSLKPAEGFCHRRVLNFGRLFDTKTLRVLATFWECRSNPKILLMMKWPENACEFRILNCLGGFEICGVNN